MKLTEHEELALAHALELLQNEMYHNGQDYYDSDWEALDGLTEKLLKRRNDG